jgi:hypothetical protein
MVALFQAAPGIFNLTPVMFDAPGDSPTGLLELPYCLHKVNL